MGGGRKWVRRAAALALAAAAAFGAGAATPVTQGWSADPDEQFMLDVKLRQYRIGDGVRAYNTPEGTCVVFGDFLATLDVPMNIDLTARKATGWAFQEKNTISIDAAKGRVEYAGKAEAIANGAIRETPEGWCVDSGALSRWFGLGVKPMTSGSVLLLESDAKLPVELAIERERRAASLKTAKFDISTLPEVRLPYRMWRAPALDFVVSAGLTYRADSGARVDRQASVTAAGEIAHLSYDAQVTTTDSGMPSRLRLRAFRSDPEAQLLGPLRATHYGLGDVSGLQTRLGGSSVNGRGAVVTNRPLTNPASFDRTRFEGDLPAGWEAELYRNGQLLAFARPDSRQRYVFEDVQLLYGQNEFDIRLYGPQGQVRSRFESLNVGKEHVPPGKTWYWAGVNQPGRELAGLQAEAAKQELPQMQATVAVEHGLDKRTSVGVIARAMLVEDERVTFVEGSVRRTIGPAMLEVAAARATDGGTAGRAQLLAKLGAVNISAEAIAASEFRLGGRPKEAFKDARLAIDAPIRIGRAVIPTHADVHIRERADGTREIDAAARLSAAIGRFNLASGVAYKRHYMTKGPAPPGELVADLIGTGRVGAVRLRGSTSFEVAPQTRFRTVELSGYWSASENVDWEGALAFDARQDRGRARISHVRRFSSMAVAVTGEAATDGSLALGFNVNFSLDPRRGLQLSRQQLASAGIVRARVFRDFNDNGTRDSGEPFEKGALITTGALVAPKTTDAEGIVTIGGLATYSPLAVGIDQTSLSDPMLTPKKALQVVVPRPGIPAEVDIALVGAGDIEGAIVKNGENGFEGLDLELIDASGKVIGTARTDFDGFFLFERAPYGRYTIRISAASAAAAGVPQDLRQQVEITPETAIVRLGSIEVAPPARIAAAQ
ncbi:MAG TPA: carboxypeptidase regulatory-like domain-containing protein [Sphingomicrobium sp.]|nr:carboxypeptidase regulatory-like domain-containing protein [Sphingomicrobium sp.]